MNGHLDLIWGTTKGLELRSGRGDGSFEPPTALFTGAGVTHILRGDLDHGGDSDALIRTVSTEELETQPSYKLPHWSDLSTVAAGGGLCTHALSLPHSKTQLTRTTSP